MKTYQSIVEKELIYKSPLHGSMPFIDTFVKNAAGGYAGENITQFRDRDRMEIANYMAERSQYPDYNITKNINNLLLSINISFNSVFSFKCFIISNVLKFIFLNI